MERVAQTTAGRGMTPLGTTPVTNWAVGSAWQGGGENTALTVSSLEGETDAAAAEVGGRNRAWSRIFPLHGPADRSGAV